MQDSHNKEPRTDEVQAEYKIIQKKKVSGGVRDFSLLKNIQTGCGTHSSSCSMGTE
jgi:hypothetical protein